MRRWLYDYQFPHWNRNYQKGLVIRGHVASSHLEHSSAEQAHPELGLDVVNADHGKPKDDLIKMRQWLNDFKLPQSMGDFLLDLGARDIDDVALLVEEGGELKEIARLDVIKLKRAVRSFREEQQKLQSSNR